MTWTIASLWSLEDGWKTDGTPAEGHVESRMEQPMENGWKADGKPMENGWNKPMES